MDGGARGDGIAVKGCGQKVRASCVCMMVPVTTNTAAAAAQWGCGTYASLY